MSLDTSLKFLLKTLKQGVGENSFMFFFHKTEVCAMKILNNINIFLEVINVENS